MSASKRPTDEPPKRVDPRNSSATKVKVSRSSSGGNIELESKQAKEDHRDTGHNKHVEEDEARKALEKQVKNAEKEIADLNASLNAANSNNAELMRTAENVKTRQDAIIAEKGAALSDSLIKNNELIAQIKTNSDIIASLKNEIADLNKLAEENETGWKSSIQRSVIDNAKLRQDNVAKQALIDKITKDFNDVEKKYHAANETIFELQSKLKDYQNQEHKPNNEPVQTPAKESQISLFTCTHGLYPCSICWSKIMDASFHSSTDVNYSDMTPTPKKRYINSTFVSPAVDYNDLFNTPSVDYGNFRGEPPAPVPVVTTGGPYIVGPPKFILPRV